jgi:3-isopropylmalate/(R)-2-methylmalate dehydratase large subunit
LGSTVFSKIWESHVLAEESGQSLLYIDRHIIHEVTSPVAFEGLISSNRSVRRPDLTFAVMDHNVPTADRSLPVADELSAAQMSLLKRNAERFGVRLFDYYSPDQGIVHVVGPELGITLPGVTLVCGDSHTATHGALGALGFGIGTSEVEHVLATQTLWLKKPKEMEIRLTGTLRRGVTAKDVILWVIRNIGVGGAIGHVVEFTGDTIEAFGVEQRMTLTNMSVEGGARTAIVSPDDKVFHYVWGRRYAPKGGDWDEALSYWRTLRTDGDAHYDSKHVFNVSSLEPQVTWGTNPSMCVGVTEEVPSPADGRTDADKVAIERALKYMGLAPGTKITDIRVDRVFIGSCTNAKLSDLLDAARVVKGRRVARGVRAMVVPGSQSVKRRAEELGLHKIFLEAGFEWRNSGCSLCLGMNEDRLSQGERCASTSNRNFENRQGPGGRTHLVSPPMAAAAAIYGHFVDVRELDFMEV